MILDGISARKIAEKLKISRTAVNKYVNLAKESSLGIAGLLALPDCELSKIMCPEADQKLPDQRHPALVAYFKDKAGEMKKRGVTRFLLWEEYKEKNPASHYSYSQYCEHYAKYVEQNKLCMHLLHVPGEYVQIDFAGKKLYYTDLETGELIECPVLVCTLPFSGFTYVEALVSQRQEHLFPALNRCMEYFGGTPMNLLTDNMKQMVVKNERYEFTFTQLAEQWGVHYNTNLDATRVRKPKDKPSVENSVYVSYLRIYARLRNEMLLSLGELNQRVRDLLEEHNSKNFQGKEHSRRDLFLAQEKEALRPLPPGPFVVKHRITPKLGPDYHITIREDMHHYSAPYQYVGKHLEVVYDCHEVEIFHAFDRIAIHKRNYRRYGYTTLEGHMPKAHLAYAQTKGWSPDYFKGIAATVGPACKVVMGKILASRSFVQQSFKSCQGIVSLSQKYGDQRLEAACTLCKELDLAGYRAVKNILENNRDKLAQIEETQYSIPIHKNTRGASAYS
jgi:transposase